MKYLFWNVGTRDDINAYLESLIITYLPNIIALAEYHSNGNMLCNRLRTRGHSYYYIPPIGSRLSIFSTIPRNKIFHADDARHYTVKIFPYSHQEDHITVFLHLPSKLYDDPERVKSIVRTMKQDVKSLSERTNTKNILYIGDFNMNPFETPMLSASEFHAVSSREIASGRQRILDGQSYEYLYNPMWNLLGDAVLPEGTYFYKAPGYIANYWNIFDQFLVSASLVKDVDINSIEIITRTSQINLANRNGKPCISDHFPLFFELKGDSYGQFVGKTR